MSSGRKILFLTEESPFPATDGRKIRDSHLIQLLLEKTRVELLCFAAGSSSPLPPKLELSLLRETHAPVRERLARLLMPDCLGPHSSELIDLLKTRGNSTEKEEKVLWVSRMAMAKYIPIAKAAGYRVILDEPRLESELHPDGALTSFKRWSLAWLSTQYAHYEKVFCRLADRVIVASETDAKKLRKLAPQAAIDVIPNSVDLNLYRDIRANPGHTLLFFGRLDSRENVEGLLWFKQKILPRLRAALGEMIPRIVIAGSHPSAELREELTASGMELKADPESFLPLLAEAAVVFVPVRSSGGARVKILEAMAAGRAVVSTGMGAEGLQIAPTYDIWIADQADAFTSAILRLLRDPQLRSATGTRAFNTVQAYYDEKNTRQRIDEILRA